MKRWAALTTVSAVILTMASPAVAAGHSSGRFDRPYSGYAPKTTLLRDATPAKAGLDPAPIDAALAQVAGWTQPSGSAKPLYAGAVTLLGHDGKIVTRTAAGLALKYADGQGTELPADQQIPMRTDTIFDLASVSKLFTSIVTLQLVEKGKVEIHDRLAPALEGADVVMMLRVQKERMNAAYFPSEREYSRRYGLDRDRFAKMPDEAIVMHPGPMNRGMEIAAEVADSPRSTIVEQVANGVTIRMAVLYLLLGGENA